MFTLCSATACQTRDGFQESLTRMILCPFEWKIQYYTYIIQYCYVSSMKYDYKVVASIEK